MGGMGNMSGETIINGTTPGYFLMKVAGYLSQPLFPLFSIMYQLHLDSTLTVLKLEILIMNERFSLRRLCRCLVDMVEQPWQNLAEFFSNFPQHKLPKSCCSCVL